MAGAPTHQQQKLTHSHSFTHRSWESNRQSTALPTEPQPPQTPQLLLMQFDMSDTLNTDMGCKLCNIIRYHLQFKVVCSQCIVTIADYFPHLLSACKCPKE